jgi:hypothetical protein
MGCSGVVWGRRWGCGHRRWSRAGCPRLHGHLAGDPLVPSGPVGSWVVGPGGVGSGAVQSCAAVTRAANNGQICATGLVGQEIGLERRRSRRSERGSRTNSPKIGRIRGLVGGPRISGHRTQASRPDKRPATRGPTWPVARRPSPDGSGYTAVARAAGDQLAGNGERLRGGLSSTAEHRIVAPKVTGSKPVGHPNSLWLRSGVAIRVRPIGGPRGWPSVRGWRASEDLPPNIKHRNGHPSQARQETRGTRCLSTVAQEARESRRSDPDTALQCDVSHQGPAGAARTGAFTPNGCGRRSFP